MFPPRSGRVAASAVVAVAVTAVISFIAVVVPVLASAVIAWLSRSFRASIQVAVWATALGTPLMFVRWLLEAPHWQQHRAGLLLDSHAAPIGQNLADAITWLSVVLPVWALSFAVIGTVFAIAVRRRLRVLRDPGSPPQGDTILV